MTDRIDNILHNEKYLHLMKLIDEKEENRIFCRHGLTHSLDVARIGCILSMDEGVSVDRELLYAAALLHDIGRADPDDSGEAHHLQSVELAEDILRTTGFTADETAAVCTAIASHNTDGMDRDGLAYILYRADKLSRCCFDCKAADECYWPDDIRNNKLIY